MWDGKGGGCPHPMVKAPGAPGAFGAAAGGGFAAGFGANSTAYYRIVFE